eukprot:scaffold302405_cov19-Prasinocladus_malaysianus.AAC.1
MPLVSQGYTGPAYLIGVCVSRRANHPCEIRGHGPDAVGTSDPPPYLHLFVFNAPGRMQIGEVRSQDALRIPSTHPQHTKCLVAEAHHSGSSKLHTISTRTTMPGQAVTYKAQRDHVTPQTHQFELHNCT